MLPQIAPEAAVDETTKRFLQVLGEKGFDGERCQDVATRLTMATDNSIYQVLPAAVVFPSHAQDIQCLLQLAQQPEFHQLHFSPRGGGTGTNGQSLNHGIIVDCSRHMNHILEVNVDEAWVRVQPGVVLDQLNAALKPEGYFFAPTLSPSSRATLGGMFSTDACGKGSCLYGRTSQHVLEARCLLSDGTEWVSHELDLDQLALAQHAPGLVGEIHRQVDEVVTTHADAINTTLPKLSRFITGYNLAMVYNQSRDRFNLSYLLSGSEGTLAFISELKLKLTPIPKSTYLVAIKYDRFSAALEAARALLAKQPAAIETIDDNVFSAAKEDVIYHAVQAMLDPDGNDEQTRAINLVEFVGDDAEKVKAQSDALCQALRADEHIVGFHATQQPDEIAALWDLRKKSVGLLANVPGSRRPMPFVEDTAVPPEQLADYVREFRQVLDRHGLKYGMFGHVDAGCLHVRPSLDMTQEADAKLVKVITHEVHQLVRKYGGILWAEHGRGFRSEYTEAYFGAELYQGLRQIKQAFDPDNRLNRGKIVTAMDSNEVVVKVEGPLRGEQDRQISVRQRQQFDALLRCNGNGQCFHYSSHEVICPSYKGLRDRVHSPKGRATLMREWLRLLSQKHYLVETTAAPAAKGRLKAVTATEDFSKAVYDAMSGCLGCKGCATACPVKVDIPEAKAHFLAHYHSRYRRRWRDYLVRSVEKGIHWQSRWPRLARLLMGNVLSQKLMRQVGLVGLPQPAIVTLRQGLKQRGARPYSAANMASACQQVGSDKVVALVSDVFSNTFSPQVVLDTYDLLTHCGYQVFVLPWRENGKPLHVLGFLGDFKRLVHDNQRFYQAIAAQGVALVGVDPSMSLVYRDEYTKWFNGALGFQVQLLQEWFVNSGALEGLKAVNHGQKAYVLFGHCSEKSLAVASQKQWQAVFAAVGLHLETRSVGCCGMAGLYGHQREHEQSSRQIYAQSWQQQLQADTHLAERLLVTGFSCRSQVKRIDGIVVRHPVSVLVEVLCESGALTH